MFREAKEGAYGLFASDFACVRERVRRVCDSGNLTQGNVFWEKHVRGREHAGTLDGVFEFADVAGPGMALQEAHGIFGNREFREAEAGGNFLDEIFR